MLLSRQLYGLLLLGVLRGAWSLSQTQKHTLDTPPAQICFIPLKCKLHCSSLSTAVLAQLTAEQLFSHELHHCSVTPKFQHCWCFRVASGCEVALKSNSLHLPAKAEGSTVNPAAFPSLEQHSASQLPCLCTCGPRPAALADWPWALTTRTLDSRAACICPILMCAMTEVTPTWISTTCVRTRQNKIQFKSDYSKHTFIYTCLIKTTALLAASRYI